MTQTVTVPDEHSTAGFWLHTGRLRIRSKLANGSLASITLPDDWGGGGGAGVAYIEIAEIARPANPAAGKIRLYAKSDHGLYILDSTGAERRLDITTLEAVVSYA